MYYDPVECGMRISKLRMELGKTQQQLADKLNISLDHYRALENGRRGGSLDLLIELAITFDGWIHGQPQQQKRFIFFPASCAVVTVARTW